MTTGFSPESVVSFEGNTSSSSGYAPAEPDLKRGRATGISMTAVVESILSKEEILANESTRESVAPVFFRMNNDDDPADIPSDDEVSAFEAEAEAERLSANLLIMAARQEEERLEVKEKVHAARLAAARAQAEAALTAATAARARLNSSKNSVSSACTLPSYPEDTHGDPLASSSKSAADPDEQFFKELESFAGLMPENDLNNKHCSSSPEAGLAPTTGTARQENPGVELVSNLGYKKIQESSKEIPFKGRSGPYGPNPARSGAVFRPCGAIQWASPGGAKSTSQCGWT